MELRRGENGEPIYLRLRISRHLPSLNVMMRPARTIRKQAAWVKSQKRVLGLLLLGENEGIQEAFKLDWAWPLTFRQTHQYAGPVRDIDNVVPKFSLDVLVDLGVLPDDKPSYVSSYEARLMDVGKKKLEGTVFELFIPAAMDTMADDDQTNPAPPGLC